MLPMNYFAYGSNLLPQRLQRRTPSARVVASALLPGHRLHFHKRGEDGSGKCNAYRTDDPQDQVFGIVYTLSQAERAELDRVEGPGYIAMPVEVLSAGQAISAFAYIARAETVVPDLLPFDWYRDLVLAGARRHEFDDHYIRRWIESLPVQADPDPTRSIYAREILAEAASNSTGRTKEPTN
jgi:gamma-glutamylcyclotransferase